MQELLLFNRIVDLWNSLPCTVRQAPSINIFERSVKDFLLIGDN